MPKMKLRFSDFRFRTRLALVLFLTMAATGAALMLTYERQQQRVKAYVSAVTSDLLAISQLTHQTVSPKDDPNQILKTYTDGLQKAGLKVDATSPSGEVVASTDPKQLNKKIKIRKRPLKANESPIQISAKFPDVDVDPEAGQTTYSVQFPIVQDNKVIGYVVVHGVSDQVESLLRHTYLMRSFWILTAMFAGMFAVVYLAFLFTKPIDKLVEAAHHVAQGQLDVSLPFAGKDEMGLLAQTFNHMVGRLRENRQLQERLNEAEKSSLLGRFASTVAHEVRNSLNFINLSIDQIRAKHSDHDERAARELQRNLNNIKDEVSRLNRLVNDFLSAGRQAPPEFASCDIQETVRQAVALVEKQAKRQGIAIAMDLPPDCPSLRADAAQMKTCFLNILTNAIQAMPRGGKIQITARCDLENGNPGLLELRFSDTGSGIPPQNRERVFAPFFSTKPTGFGLGLAITKKVVEDHGGHIRVADGEKPGTVMVIELPLPRPTPSRPEAARPLPVA